ncbi:MAG: hypothetical protein WBB45_14625 [Cyclobacteriaceae bacterium]
MKRFTIITVCLILSFSLKALAQENDYLTDQLEFLSIPKGGVMFGKSLPPPDTKGSYFLNDEWSETGMLELYMGKAIDGVQLKYNMNSNLLYVKLEGSDEHYFLEGNKIKSFIIEHESMGVVQKFINASEFSKDMSKAEGFYEIYLDAEPYSIVRSNYTYMKKANYVAGVDMGRRDNEIKKKMDYFVFDGDKLIKVRGSNNKNLNLFGNKRNQIKEYAKINSLNLKEPADLVKAVVYYNSL